MNKRLGSLFIGKGRGKKMRGEKKNWIRDQTHYCLEREGRGKVKRRWKGGRSDSLFIGRREEKKGGGGLIKKTRLIIHFRGGEWGKKIIVGCHGAKAFSKHAILIRRRFPKDPIRTRQNFSQPLSHIQLLHSAATNSNRREINSDR